MLKVNILTFDNPTYPECLKNIYKPPAKLFYAGADPSSWLDKPRLAVIGSRKATSYGLGVTARFINQLAQTNVVIISGLAYGIDAAAHRAALSSNIPTVAVLGTSLDNIYPSSHYHLACQIMEQGGTLISEYSKGTPGLRQNFIARNRLISGLSHAVLITEAAINSGSLHTARFGLEQGKTVMAIPGDINKTNAIGVNNLIKSGALMVTEVEDIYLALGIKPDQSVKVKRRLAPELASIYKLIGDGITNQENLAIKLKLSPEKLNRALTELELNGLIKAVGGGQWTPS